MSTLYGVALTCTGVLNLDQPLHVWSYNPLAKSPHGAIFHTVQYIVFIETWTGLSDPWLSIFHVN